MKNDVKCSIISIDIEENDPVDVRAGGPYYLGYDYVVKASEAEEIMDFIKDIFNKTNRKYISIYISDKDLYKDAEKVWDKAKIYKDLTGKSLENEECIL